MSAASGAAQGAAIGSEVAPGWGTAIGAVAGGLLGSKDSSAAGGGAMPAYNIFQPDSSMNNGGWTVATGKAKATSTNATSVTAAVGSLSGSVAGVPVLLIAGVFLLLALRHKKS